MAESHIKVAQNFYLDEFVDPYTYFNHKDNGQSLVAPQIIDICQLLRVKKGSSIGVNSWWSMYIALRDKGIDIKDIITEIERTTSFRNKKIHKWSGFRSEHCTIGARKSAHKLGKAADPKGDQLELIQIVKDSAKEFYDMGLRRVEDPNITKGWLHVDIEERNCRPNSIKIIDWTSTVGYIEW